MPERDKEDKMQGGAKNNLMGGYSGEGKEDKMWKGCEKNLGGGGYAGEGKEDKMRGGGPEKKLRGVCRRG